MKSLIASLALVSCLLAAEVASAGVIWFAGNYTGGGGGNWLMKVNYTPNNSGATASALTGTLELSSGTVDFTSITVFGTTTTPLLSIEEGGPLDRVSIVSGLSDGGSKAGLLNFYSPFTGIDIGLNPNATDSNIAALTKLGVAVSGSVTNLSGFGGNLVLSGSVVAPEPGTFALLGGLGLVVGRRIWKRRSARTQNAATV